MNNIVESIGWTIKVSPYFPLDELNDGKYLKDIGDSFPFLHSFHCFPTRNIQMLLKSIWTKLFRFILAIKRTPHFGVRSTLAPALNFGGVRMTAPALQLHLQKPFFF